MEDFPVKINNALISVADKTGVVEFARGLVGLGITLLATGGTYTALKDAGVTVRSLQDDMNLPQALSGGSRRCTRLSSGRYLRSGRPSTSLS